MLVNMPHTPTAAKATAIRDIWRAGTGPILAKGWRGRGALGRFETCPESKSALPISPAKGGSCRARERQKRRALSGLVIGLALLGFADVAGAVELINEDQQTYTVVITEGEKVRKLRLRAGDYLPDVCTQCVIAVPEVGEVATEPGDVIIIGDGKLELRS